MSKITAAITAVGKYLPDYILTNKELETLVETNDDWITSRTGIKERRILKEPNQGTSYMAIRAAKDLLHKSNIDPKEIDMVIVATATPDLPVASTAVFTATEIGATNAFAYDLQAACSSFLYGMSTAASYIASGRYKKVLLIGADKMSSIIDALLRKMGAILRAWTMTIALIALYPSQRTVVTAARALKRRAAKNIK